MISIVDVGSGNINSFIRCYKTLGYDAQVVKTKNELSRAKKIILPGVGSFDSFMTKLNHSGLKKTLEDQVLVHKVPILGVCLGLQIFANDSEEGIQPGLCWINATNKKFTSYAHLPSPAMGWNSIESTSNFPLLENVDYSKGFYFLHSYYFENAEPVNSYITSDYGHSFVCGIQKENIFGVQFHPEKSHSNGLTLLKNFAELRMN